MSDFKSFVGKLGQKRIDSPMAKYNSIGQLLCIVCNQVVKSELVWNAHISSKIHADNKNKLKMKLVGEMAKPLSNSNKEPVKEKSKTNSSSKRSISNVEKSSKIEEVSASNKKQKLTGIIKSTGSIDLNKINAELNKEETVSTSDPESKKSEQNAEITPVVTELQELAGNPLPEGFFDDPELDAKARGQSRSDNLDAEFEEFKKIIQTEEVKSEFIIEKDDLMSNVDRDIEEVDDLITRWSKIEKLHIQREALIKNKKETQEKIDVDQEMESEDSDNDLDLDDVLNFNLRSKNRF